MTEEKKTELICLACLTLPESERRLILCEECKRNETPMCDDCQFVLCEKYKSCCNFCDESSFSTMYWEICRYCKKYTCEKCRDKHFYKDENYCRRCGDYHQEQKMKRAEAKLVTLQLPERGKYDPEALLLEMVRLFYPAHHPHPSDYGGANPKETPREALKNGYIDYFRGAPIKTDLTKGGPTDLSLLLRDCLSAHQFMSDLKLWLKSHVDKCSAT